MAEVALALSIVPIIFTAAEHYNQAYTLLKRFRKYEIELGRLSRYLRVQKSLFWTHCEILLTGCTNESPRILLDHPDHPEWTAQSAAIRRGLAAKLGNSIDAFVDLVSDITTELQALGMELSKCQNSSESAGGSTLLGITRRTWHRTRWATSQPKIERNIKRVRELVQDLAALCLQQSSISDLKAGSRKQIAETGNFDFDTADRYATVRKMSQGLYEALIASPACMVQNRTFLCLEPRIPLTREIVQFDLAIRQDDLGEVSPHDQGPVWISVESEILQSSQHSKVDVHLELGPMLNSLQLSRAGTSTISTDVIATASSIAAGSAQGSPVSRSPSALSRSSADLENLSRSSDLRATLQHNLANCTNRLAVGYLERPQYLVVIDPQQQATRAGKTLSSLAESYTFKRPGLEHGLLSSLGRLRLARQLANALLSFHSTSWLCPAWNSESVMLCNSMENTQVTVGECYEPFVPLSINLQAMTLSIPTASSAPNSYLFGLGVLLLELAFEKPLKEMRQDEDMLNGHEHPSTDVLAARRAKGSVASKMGIRYSKIVRRCLDCTFDCEPDLNDPALQESVYRQVVCELQAMEQRQQEIIA